MEPYMEMRTIHTDAGDLELVAATVDHIKAIACYWPMEIVTGQGPARYGLVFQRGEKEVHGIKLQPADTEEADARFFYVMHRSLIAAALPEYLAKQHRGVMLPCAYFKPKPSGLVESGFAFFVGPDAASKSSPDKDIFDYVLGEGASSMVFDMVFAIGHASKKHNLPLFTAIGMDVCPRLALGSLSMHFLIEGPRLIVVKHPLREDDLVWKVVVSGGFSTLPYASMFPAALPAVLPPGITHI
jgi:hypothetical protein